MIVDVRHLKLESFHTKLGAKFVSFAGYRMPISYPLGVKGEHLQTRKAIGLFDVSHMGQIIIEGPQAAEALEKTSASCPARNETRANTIFAIDA